MEGDFIIDLDFISGEIETLVVYFDFEHNAVSFE